MGMFDDIDRQANSLQQEAKAQRDARKSLADRVRLEQSTMENEVDQMWIEAAQVLTRAHVNPHAYHISSTFEKKFFKSVKVPRFIPVWRTPGHKTYITSEGRFISIIHGHSSLVSGGNVFDREAALAAGLNGNDMILSGGGEIRPIFAGLRRNPSGQIEHRMTRYVGYDNTEEYWLTAEQSIMDWLEQTLRGS